MNEVVGQRTSAAKAIPRRSRISEHDQTQALLRWIVLGVLRLVRAVAGFAIGFAALALAAFGVFRDPGRTGTPQLLALAGLAALLIARLFERLQRSRIARGHRALWTDLELGTLFVAASFVMIEITGGPTSLFYPLVYALVAFLVAFHGIGQSIYFLVVILGVEAAVWMLQPEAGGWRLYVGP